MRRRLLLFFLLATIPMIAVAADISGSWFFEQVNSQNGNKTHTYYVFKATGTGKLKRKKAYHSHILSKKTTKRKRGLRQSTLVDKTNETNIKRILPYI